MGACGCAGSATCTAPAAVDGTFFLFFRPFLVLVALLAAVVAFNAAILFLLFGTTGVATGGISACGDGPRFNDGSSC